MAWTGHRRAQWVDDDRVHTFARSFGALEDLGRDALALWLHVDPRDVEVELDVALPAGLSDELADLRRQREKLEATQASVLERQRTLAVRLIEDEGMTYRDAARFLGLSHQRIAHLKPSA